MSKVYDIDTNIDLRYCYLWQYGKAESLTSLMSQKEQWYNNNVTGFWDNFYTNIFNLQTANSFGLNLWGSLLNVVRPTYENNGQTIVFTDDQYRILLLGQLMLQNSNGSIHDFNNYLNFIFPNKPVFVIPYLTMEIRLVFYYQPDVEELAIIQASNFLPLPAGVEVNYAIIPPDTTFGFDGQEMSNWDNGTFFA